MLKQNNMATSPEARNLAIQLTQAITEEVDRISEMLDFAINELDS